MKVWRDKVTQGESWPRHRVAKQLARGQPDRKRVGHHLADTTVLSIMKVRDVGDFCAAEMVLRQSSGQLPKDFSAR